MAQIRTHADHLEFHNPVLIEGLPGIGLVGKLAVEQLIDSLGMTHYATVLCDGIPPVVVYRKDTPQVQSPVRIYGDPDHDLLALQSDIPISPSDAPDFVSVLTNWFQRSETTPVYLSGKAAERDGSTPSMHAVSTGSGASLLERAGIRSPPEDGLISGPTGALLHQAQLAGLDSVGLIVESNPQSPDPEAARVLIKHGITNLIDIDIPTNALTEQAEEIQQTRQHLAHQMQQADDESSQAQPLRMFQ